MFGAARKKPERERFDKGKCEGKGENSGNQGESTDTFVGKGMATRDRVRAEKKDQEKSGGLHGKNRAEKKEKEMMRSSGWRWWANSLRFGTSS